MSKIVLADELLPAAILLLLIFLLTTFLNRLYPYPSSSSSAPLTLPPTPFRWPIIGHGLSVLRSSSQTDFINHLRDKHGPIFTLWLGSTPSIFITSPDIAHEALVQKGSLFAARPRLPSRALFTSNYRNINASSYGSHWRTLRRNMVSEMLSSSKLKAFKPDRQRIVELLVRRLKNEAKENAGVVRVHSNCRFAMFELLLVMCLGSRVDDSTNQEVADLLDKIVPYQRGLPGDFFPLLRFLERKQMAEARMLRESQIKLFHRLIEKHKTLRRMGKITPGNYLDTLLNLEPEGLTTEDIVTLCTEFLVAGTDSTVNCMEWAMAHLVVQQDVQAKLHEEIERVVGRKPVEEEDVERLHYLQAVIKETLRLHPPAHFTLPHAVTQQCKLAGYDIPTDAIVNFHIASISRDAEVWPDPMEFKPERFVEREVDMTGTRQVTMIPFGAGRRMCPGAGLATMHAEVMVGSLVQAFRWRRAREGEVVDMSERSVFTVIMNTPLRASIRERV